MGDSTDKLEARQARLIAALLSCRNISQACEKSKIGQSTYRRWAKTDAFRSALRHAEDQAIDQAGRALLVGWEYPITTLQRAMVQGENGSVRVRAAIGWLNALIKFRDYTDIIPRLEALEEAERERQKIENPQVRRY